MLIHWTRRLQDHAPRMLTLGFEEGNLISVNGNRLALIEAIAVLNREVGKYDHGILAYQH